MITHNIALTSAIEEEATHTVQLTAQGMAPGSLTVEPGSVIAFVNMDLADHAVIGSGWDSGVLPAGASYRIKLDDEGTITLDDAFSATAISVQVTASRYDGERVFLEALDGTSCPAGQLPGRSPA